MECNFVGFNEFPSCVLMQAGHNTSRALPLSSYFSFFMSSYFGYNLVVSALSVFLKRYSRFRETGLIESTVLVHVLEFTLTLYSHLIRFKVTECYS